MKQEPRQRLLTLRDLYNVRDLGGYPTQDGRSTKWDKYLRAGAEGSISTDEQEYLYGYGVRAVVDLRLPEEREKQPSPFKELGDSRYYAINLLENFSFANSKDLRDLGDAYVAWTGTVKEKILEVFRIFLDYPNAVVLFHCAAGKDRTGLIAALLLGLAGCESRIIVADYAETFANNSRKPGYTDVSPREQALQYSEPEYMEKLLAHLDSVYGGPAAYLAHIGLKAADLTILKESFTL